MDTVQRKNSRKYSRSTSIGCHREAAFQLNIFLCKKYLRSFLLEVHTNIFTINYYMVNIFLSKNSYTKYHKVVVIPQGIYIFFIFSSLPTLTYLLTLTLNLTNLKVTTVTFIHLLLNFTKICV